MNGWKRDVCFVCDASYPEPQMERESFERALYADASLADLAGGFCIVLYGRLHGQRRYSFPPCPFLSADQRRAFLCQNPAHDFRLLGLCMDVSPSGVSLEKMEAGMGISLTLPPGIRQRVVWLLLQSLRTKADYAMRCPLPCM